MKPTGAYSIDWPFIMQRGRLTVDPVAFYAVYRQRNARVVQELLSALPVGSTAALWALDMASPVLTQHTYGIGAGDKFSLLNKLLLAVPPASKWAVFSDDDYVFVRNDMRRLVATSAVTNLGMTQPAHVSTSHWSHPLTLARKCCVARQTPFVEIGPCFLVSPTAQEKILPFPESAGMGWGLEARWRDKLGADFAVIDEVRINHLHAVGLDYDVDVLVGCTAAVQTLLELARVKSLGPPWRPWTRLPPW